MKNTFSFILFFFFIIGNRSLAQCDSTLWNHVYNDYRLYVMNKCMSVTGTVYSLSYEADGDVHIRLTVDPMYTYMLNSANYSGEDGKLVCEPICDTTVTQTDAIASCTGFTNTVFIPNAGEYVQVTGSYVTDNDHGWNEIHPVSRIEIQTRVPTEPSAGAKAPDVTVFPNPADGGFVNFKFSDKLSSTAYIYLYNAAGRNVGQFMMLQTTAMKLPTTRLPEGTYFYHVMQDHNEIATGSFSVVH